MRANFERENSALSLPIVQAARIYAQQFAQQQNSIDKSEQVRLNTLAVWVVKDYLQMMDVATDLVNSQSWNSVMRIVADVADLKLPGIGHLECRPVTVRQTECYVPPETWEERVGYVIVEIDELEFAGKIIGFIPQVKSEYLRFDEILPIEDLFEHLKSLQAAPNKIPINLSQWFNGIFEVGWQNLEILWNQPNLGTAQGFRNYGLSLEQRKALSITQRAKLIKLGNDANSEKILLIVEICPQSGGRTNILIQLRAVGSASELTSILPSGLKLAVMDSDETVFLEAQTQPQKNQMQLEFHGEVGETFSIRVLLEDSQVTEDFVI
jgi:Protein of unknown function (DUF1822)